MKSRRLRPANSGPAELHMREAGNELLLAVPEREKSTRAPESCRFRRALPGCGVKGCDHVPQRSLACPIPLNTHKSISRNFCRLMSSERGPPDGSSREP